MRFGRDFQHRDRLVTAALEEFSAKGYDNASINAILAAAGMSKGQFYHHFGNKEGLYLAVVELLLHRKRAHFLAHPVSPGADVFATLQAQLVAGVAFAREDPALDRFARSWLRERGRPIYEVVQRQFGLDRDTGLRQLVAAAHARGDFRPDLTVAFVVRAIAVVLENAPTLLDLQAPGDLDARVGELIDFLRRGLGRS